MTILIKAAKVVAHGNKNHLKHTDILIENGIITRIKNFIPARGGEKIIEHPHLCVSAGWLDMQAVSGDPGFEFKEDLDSLVKCAAAGGFTEVCVHQFNEPALDNKAQIEYIKNKTRNKVVNVIPFGTITTKGKSDDLTEMYDMKMSGAAAFSNYKNPVKNSGTMLRALLYAKNLNTPVINHCSEESLAGKGQMNEGETAVALGLKGIPALAEELMLQRDIMLLQYAGGKLHVPLISSKGSVELIKKAKSSGLHITCGVSPVHLLFDESELNDFDSHAKLNPPLRNKKDMRALRSALEQGVIDVIASDHCPQDTESKELEFDLAEFGMINLQTAFGCALTALKEKHIEQIIASLTANPRKILNLKQVKLEVGETANLTLFTCREDSVLSEENNHSKSKNTFLFGKKLQGKVYGIVNGSKSFFTS